jgi:uncharacterized protein YggU (UPF0235/DUF167 family)
MGVVAVRVLPRSSTSRVEVVADAIVVRVRAPAAEGRATEEARRTLATALHVPRTSVALRSGRRSREKRFEVAGITEAQVRQRLLGRREGSP